MTSSDYFRKPVVFLAGMAKSHTPLLAIPLQQGRDYNGETYYATPAF